MLDKPNRHEQTMNRLHGYYLISMFYFLMLSQMVPGNTVIDRALTRDTVHKTIYHLYEETNKARKLLKDGETILCLQLCQQVFNQYQSFPKANTYLGYLLSYKAQCYRKLGNLELSRAYHLLVDWYAKLSNDQALHKSNQTNRFLLESDHYNHIRAEEIVRAQLRSINLNPMSMRKSLIMNNMATNSIALRNFDQAQECFDVLDEMIGKDQIGVEFNEPLFFRNYGYFYHLQGDLELAKEKLETAIEMYKSSLPAGHVQIAYTHKYLGELYADLNLKKKALNHYKKSINIFHYHTLQNDQSSQSIMPVAYETVYLSGVSSYIRFVNSLFDNEPELLLRIDMEETFDLIRSAENRINSFVQAQPPSSSVFIITDKVRGLFDAGIQLALHLYESTNEKRFLNQAFEWSIRSKGYSIRVQAEKEQLALQTPETAALFVQQKSLMEKIRAYSKMDADSLYPALVDSLIMWSTKFEHNNDSLNLPIVISAYSIQVQSRLWNQNLISYHLFKESAIAFVVDGGKVTCHPINFPLGFEDSVKKFKSILYSERPRYYSDNEVLEYDQLGHDLYEVLISPLQKFIGSRNLIIQPDGFLLGLPFELMITQKIQESEQISLFRDLKYMDKEFRISYWMGTDTDMKNGNSQERKIRLIGCPQDDDPSQLFGELQVLQEIVSATDEGRSLSDYRVIHFASHYQMNDTDPLESGLVCDAGSSEPYLKLSEILADDFTGTRIFINGCNTGNGKVNSGQGLVSMGLVFGIGGAQEVISHLWQASDDVSKDLAVDFYQKGIPKNFSKRLQRVKTNYLKSVPAGLDHPHFWGGMVCSAKPTKRIVWYYWVGMLVVFCGGVLLWRREKIR